MGGRVGRCVGGGGGKGVGEGDRIGGWVQVGWSGRGVLLLL